MEDNGISHRIKELREEKGISQSALAKDLSVKQQTVAQWEKGERALKAESIVLLAKYFNVTADYILGISEYKQSQAANIGATTGLTENAINALKSLKSHSAVLSYCLSKFIEQRELFGVLLSIDSYIWHKLSNAVYENLILKEFVNQKKLNISQSDIDERGTQILNEPQKLEFERSKLENLNFKLYDTDYEVYKLQKEISRLVDALCVEVLEDDIYNAKEITDYERHYASPYLKESLGIE
ncbi:MAG: helix-turn-helix domain-containing protein [Candidatus Ornithomonoglobus sp.]